MNARIDDLLVALRDAAVDPPEAASTREILDAGTALLEVRAPLFLELGRLSPAEAELGAAARATLAEIRALDVRWEAAFSAARVELVLRGAAPEKKP